MIGEGSTLRRARPVAGSVPLFTHDFTGTAPSALLLRLLLQTLALGLIFRSSTVGSLIEASLCGLLRSLPDFPRLCRSRIVAHLIFDPVRGLQAVTVVLVCLRDLASCIPDCLALLLRNLGSFGLLLPDEVPAKVACRKDGLHNA